MKGIKNKVFRIYKACGFILLNTLILFTILNLIAFFVLKLRSKAVVYPPLLAQEYQPVLQKIYPDLKSEDIKILLKESWLRPLSYEAYTSFKETAYAGKYVNVSPHGFRLSKNQGPWSPRDTNFNIFVFGGSTTFGYGVPDAQTIPSYLQEALQKNNLGKKIFVYNFGTAHYYSTQESILFQRLVASGIKPDMAIFIDGLNEFSYTNDEHVLSKDLRKFFTEEHVQSRAIILKTLLQFPLFSQASDILNNSKNEENKEKPLSYYNNKKVLNTIITRYTANMSMIRGVAREYNIQPVFILQPVPVYNYDVNKSPFRYGNFLDTNYAHFGYGLLLDKYKNNELDQNFYWGANLHKESTDPLYADKTHYSPKFSKVIAEKIAEFIKNRNLVK